MFVLFLIACIACAIVACVLPHGFVNDILRVIAVLCAMLFLAGFFNNL